MLASSPAVSARTHIIDASGSGGIEPAGRIAVHPSWSAGGQTAEFGLMLCRGTGSPDVNSKFTHQDSAPGARQQFHIDAALTLEYVLKE